MTIKHMTVKSYMVNLDALSQALSEPVDLGVEFSMLLVYADKEKEQLTFDTSLD